jgi:uroporphyrinogen decarboxylase
VTEPLIVRAARREPVERTPVWFMRQAGRSLPEYRKLRERYAFFDAIRTPEVCAEITLQPVRRHDVDAAVIFSDIVVPGIGMGVDVELVEGVGPVVRDPVRTADRLRELEPQEEVYEAVRLVRAELRGDKTVVGFCGGPFTVAGYLIEGKPSRDYATVKQLMYREPETWHAIMDKLADGSGAYVRGQVDAGADVIQLFDSWVGVLSVADYEEYVAPYSARVLASARVPTIHFGTGTTHLLPAMARAGGDVIGLDWRQPLDAGWALAGDDKGVQGNLDPALLLAPWERIQEETQAILTRAAGRPGHIFNLGHGVLPQTDPDVLTRLVAFLQEAGVEARV